MSSRAADSVPDAVAALVAAVIEDNPVAPPHRQAVLVVRALRRDGWRVVAPSGRATKTAVSGSDPTSNPHSGAPAA